MKSLLKNFTVNAILSWAAALLTIVGCALYIANSLLVYYNNLSALVIIFLLLSAAALIALPLIEKKVNASLAFLVRLAAVVMIVSSVMLALKTRALSIAVVWFSVIEAGNAAANFAVNQFAVVAALLLVAIVLSVIAGFGDCVKDNKQ